MIWSFTSSQEINGEGRLRNHQSDDVPWLNIVNVKAVCMTYYALVTRVKTLFAGNAKADGVNISYIVRPGLTTC